VKVSFAFMHQLRSLTILAVIGALAVARFAGQSRPDPSPQSLAHPARIAAGDLLSITAYDAPELTQTVRVETDGSAKLLLLGPTRLAGMTASEAGKLIEEQLEARNFELHPQISVQITEGGSQAVSVAGEVNHPGVYPFQSGHSLLDAISMAGGFTQSADTHVTIKHRSDGEEQLTVELKADDGESSLAADTPVYPGDLVIVARAGVVYVLGDVGRPGGIVMQDNGHLTVLKALSQAGGANYTSAPNQAYLVHKTENGYTTTRIKVGDMLRGRVADIELVRNDILNIPTSTLKHMTLNAQDLANSAAGALVFRAANN